MPPLRSSRPSSTPRPPRTRPNESASTVELPAYQPPSAPLNTAGQNALQQIQNQTSAELHQHFKTVNEEIASSVSNIQSSLAHQRGWLDARLKKFGDGDERYKSRIAPIQDLNDRVDDMTFVLEKKTREVIDSQTALNRRQNALMEVSANAGRNEGRVMIAATQSTLGASQFRSRHDEDDDEGDELGGGGVGVLALLQQKAQDQERDYTSLSLAQKYTEHNDYISFRRNLHEGKYSQMEEQQPIMPHANTWFDENGPVFADGLQSQSSAQNREQEDSDVEAVAERINIKCPITLVDMVNPVRNEKCPHVFEKTAIEEMLRYSVQNGRRNALRAVKCPVCDVSLTAADLVPDTTLKRRIERIQATQARNTARADDEDEDDYQGTGQSMRRAQSVDTQFEPSLSISTNIKAERASGVPRQSLAPDDQNMEEDEDDEVARPINPPMSTAEVVDLDMDDDDDDED